MPKIKSAFHEFCKNVYMCNIFDNRFTCEFSRQGLVFAPTLSQIKVTLVVCLTSVPRKSFFYINLQRYSQVPCSILEML